MLDEIPGLCVRRGARLADYTRFGIGGPADVLAETGSESAMAVLCARLRAAGAPYAVIGGGTNLVVADAGYRGTVLRYTSERSP
jgi:UDP-N-acetylmuramate dehydrogenase